VTIIVSACLLGVNCRYDGKSKPNASVLELLKHHTLIPVCGEVFGGLTTPRLPSEIVGDRVMRSDGADVTAEYNRGANEVLRLCRLYNCDTAILKERSPSCGSGKIYDGTFSGTLTDGWGITAALLRDNGIKIYGESEISALLPGKEDKEK